LLGDGVTAPSPGWSLSQLSNEVNEYENSEELRFLETLNKLLDLGSVTTKTELCGVAGDVLAGDEIDYLGQTLGGEL
jgi:hypothetical protein